MAILWIVKSTPAALVFPFFVVFMIPLRLSLKFLFTPRELEAVSTLNPLNITVSQIVHTINAQIGGC